MLLERRTISVLQRVSGVVSEFGLNAKGIAKALKGESPDKVKPRIIYTFFDKKRESKLGAIGKIYQKRWFFLVSSRPLVAAGNLRAGTSVRRTITTCPKCICPAT